MRDRLSTKIRHGVRHLAKALAVVMVLAVVALVAVCVPPGGWAALGLAAVGIAVGEKLKVKITAEKGWQDPNGTSHAKDAVLELDAEKAKSLAELPATMKDALDLLRGRV